MPTEQPTTTTTEFAPNATAPLVVRPCARRGLWNKVFSGTMLLEATLTLQDIAHDTPDREVVRLVVHKDGSAEDGSLVGGLIYRPLTLADPLGDTPQTVVQDHEVQELYVFFDALATDTPRSVPLRVLSLLMGGLGMDIAWIAEGRYPTDIDATTPAAMYAMGLELTRDIALTDAGYRTTPERQLFANNWRFVLEETSHPARFK